MKAFILAGGFGRRLAHTVKDVPKPMAPVSGRPFLDYLVAQLAAQDIRHIVLLTGYKDYVLREHFKDGSAFGVRIDYSHETEPLGTGGAVRRALAGFCGRGEDVLVLNGDSFFDIPIQYFARFHLETARPITLALKYIEGANRYGTVNLRAGTIESFQEKGAGTGTGIINAGIYMINSAAFEGLASPDPCSLENDVFPGFASSGAIAGVLFPGRFIDIGVPEDYRRADSNLTTWLTSPKKKAIFLDRDGVIIVDTGYVSDASSFRLVDGAANFLRAVRRLGYELVIVTNQAGIAKAKFSEGEYAALMRALFARLKAEGIEVIDSLFCPFHPAGAIEEYRRESFDRKPSPGMVLKAAERHSIDLLSSWMIGDKESDRIDLPYLRTFLLRGSYAVEPGPNVFDSFDAILEAIQNGQDRGGLGNI